VSFNKNTWNQVKGVHVEQIMKALEKDGWEQDTTPGATIPYVHPDRDEPVLIHYHPKKTYGANLLKALLADIGWDEKDLSG
jgi:predicted RNA binding protein YcfA (HicA-like mRNA interferase family)